MTLIFILRVEAGSGSDSGDDGLVRLVGGPNEFEGRVEVCLKGVWRRWCATGPVDLQASIVVCGQLGHLDGIQNANNVSMY